MNRHFCNEGRGHTAPPSLATVGGTGTVRVGDVPPQRIRQLHGLLLPARVRSCSPEHTQLCSAAQQNQNPSFKSPFPHLSPTVPLTVAANNTLAANAATRETNGSPSVGAR